MAEPAEAPEGAVPPKLKLTLGTWNVQGFSPDKRRMVIINMLKMKIDALGLTEIKGKKAVDGIEFLEHQALLRGKGSKFAGVGLLISPELLPGLLGWGCHGDRILHADFYISDSPNQFFTLIVAYAPTATAENEEETEIFHDKLTRLTTQKTKPFILGDFNARLVPGVDGKFGQKQIANLNTRHLRDYLQKCDLESLAMRFQAGVHQRATWRHPQGKWFAIDHILCRKGTAAVRCSAKNIRISDHNPVVGVIDARPWQWHPKRKKEVQSKKLNYQITAEKRNEMNDKITQKTGEGRSIKDAIIESCREILKPPEKEKRPWITKEYRDLAEKLRKSKKRGDKTSMKTQRKELRKLRNKQFRDFVEQACEDAGNLWTAGSPPKTINHIAKLVGKKAPKLKRCNTVKQNSASMKDKSGTYGRTTNEKIKIHTEFFQEIFNRAEPDQNAAVGEKHHERHETIEEIQEEITESEVELVIKKLRKNRSSGEDGMTAEMISLLDPIHRDSLIQHIISIWEDEKLPAEENTTLIAVLEKPGADLSKAEGYRPISLINLTVKIIAMVIYEKCRAAFDNATSEAQNGFRARRQTMDHILTLRIARNLCRANKETPYFGYIDLKQAFDSVPRSLVQRVLSARGTPTKILNMIKAIYDGHAFKVKKDGEVAETGTSTTRGLKQGCPLSPILFNMVLEHILYQIDFGDGIDFRKQETNDVLEKKKKKGKGKGKGTKETRKLTHLLFADDIVICAKNRVELQRLLQHMTDTFRNYGLTVNKKKTKWQKDDNHRSIDHTPKTKNRNKRSKTLKRKRLEKVKKILEIETPMGVTVVNHPQEKLHIDGEDIERVDKFVYLGSCFNEIDDDADDIDTRVQKGNAALARINRVIWNRKTPRRLKMKMVMTFVYPSATYGCETWVLSPEARNHLDTWWMKILRRVRGVTKEDKLRSSSILKDLRTSKISEKIEERQLRYAGHVWRYGEERWTKFMLQAERPKQKTGKQQQYRKHLTNLMKSKELDTGMMSDPQLWADKLKKLYTRDDQNTPGSDEYEELNPNPE